MLSGGRTEGLLPPLSKSWRKTACCWPSRRSSFPAGRGSGPPLAGEGLRQRLAAEPQGADRAWLVTEDRTCGGYPAVADIETFFREGWQEAGSWSFPPQALRLYERR